MSAWKSVSGGNRSFLAQSLRANLLAIAASALTVLIVVATLLFGQEAAFELETGFRARSLAQLVAQQAELSVATGDHQELDRITRNALRIDDVIYAVIVDPSGAILSAAKRPGLTQQDIPAWRGSPTLEPFAHEGGNLSHRTFMNAAAPIVPSETQGLVEWETPKERIAKPALVRIGVSMEAQRNRLRRNLAMVLLVSFSGLFGLGLILTIQQRRMRKVLAPLKDLIAFTRLLAGGDLTRRTAVVRDDEVGQLAKASNEMAERLESSRRELMDAVTTAKDASRLKSEFLANMSHEIRTPLNGVLGMIDLALDGELNAEQRDYLSTATTSAHSLLSILNDLLDFSKIEAGRFELTHAPFDLISEIDHIGRAYAVHAHRKGVELVCRIAPGTPVALIGDAERLRQILQNLLSNALKFTAAGEVVVNVAMDGDASPAGIRLRFDVRDTGIGIPEDRQQCIFEAFRQVDGSTTRRYGGTGLGLAISSRLVNMMGGALTVESIPGSGSTFSFSVPFEAAPAIDPPPPPIESFTSVLVVANNRTNLSFLEETLLGWRAEVKLLSSPAEVLPAVRSASARGRPFALVIVDRALEESDGFILAEKLLAEPEPPEAVIVMTTVIDLGATARCQTLPGVEHVVKPVSVRDLRSAVLRARRRHAKLHNRVVVSADTSAGILSLRRLNVLLVEDNAVNQKLAMRLLERAGHSVAVAWDGIHAMEMLKAGSFDCVLMDVQMPRMDGLETTRAIRRLEEATGEHISIVAMTAHALDSDRDRCREAGMDDYMSKPISRDNLLRILAAVTTAGTVPVPR